MSENRLINELNEQLETLVGGGHGLWRWTAS